MVPFDYLSGLVSLPRMVELDSRMAKRFDSGRQYLLEANSRSSVMPDAGIQMYEWQLDHREETLRSYVMHRALFGNSRQGRCTCISICASCLKVAAPWPVVNLTN